MSAQDFSRLSSERSSARDSGHRLLYIASGDAQWCRQFATGFLRAWTQGGCEAKPRVRELGGSASPSAAKSWLGSETELLVVDAHTHQDIQDWLAAADTVVASGAILLLCPDSRQWPQHFSRVMGARRAAEIAAPDTPSVFILRLLSRMRAFEGIHFCTPENAPCQPAIPSVEPAAGKWQPEFPNAEQRECVAAILRVAGGRRWRPLVIRADRGRGKTTALGLAAAELMAAGKSILISALHRSAVDAAFRHAAQVSGGIQVSVDILQGGQGGQLRYLKPELLLDEPLTADLVLVDEAAMLSVSLLDALMERVPRLVFATTVHGYEGSGRGFDIRFKAILDQKRPQWRRLFLQQPVRWAHDDPVEAILRDWFLLDAEPHSAIAVAPEGSASSIIYRTVTPRDLLDDEHSLKQVFGLLVQAHYQTTPHDLVHLLDVPQLLLIAQSGQRVVAVCQVFPEGEFPLSLAQDVVAGTRRPRGHLAAQRLAHASGDACLLHRKSWRVSRVAVVNDMRRCGIGGQLLVETDVLARKAGAAFLCSSFAADVGLIQFWQSAGFLPVYFGDRRDASSGSYSVIVARPLCPSMETVLPEMTLVLQRDLPLRVGGRLPGMTVNLLAALLAVSRTNAVPAVSARDRYIAGRYAKGEISLSQCRASLWRLVSVVDVRHIAGWDITLDVLLLQAQPDAVIFRYGLQGAAELDTVMRQFFATLVDQFR